MYTALLNNQVPKNWEAAAYPSLKPLASWVKDFHARIAFMRNWLVNGQPDVFWMSGFFFPQVNTLTCSHSYTHMHAHTHTLTFTLTCSHSYTHMHAMLTLIHSHA